ncbi:uncharacterized protein MYCFIDRAFT_179910 [Pseudocercospora fijiensis CIRAD86]|uniref:Uncharacterized protein n=1 Tax=Pseudocercospora fijiensis (strain CIRAD86) TaxID=383855 RepID=M2ZDZ6_PSEFD|nr:uncharacterized protein MYCFIDRAFT_179910 [Pseudocercospora fijiensis CIRAD86]EME77334.1 hypothetical protein MYCFIDRAFT_179910 [Pseudocercospora fijiensis CIRAD86]
MDISMLAPPRARAPGLSEYLREQFDELEDGTTELVEMTEEQQKDMEDRERVMIESEDFRLESPSYQVRLDKHLWEYRAATMIYIRHLGEEDSLVTRDSLSSANDHIFFPEDMDRLFEYCKHYFIWAVQRIRPLRKVDVSPRLATIISRRWSLRHWIKNKLGNKAPNYRTYHSKTNKSLHYAARVFGINKKAKTKAYFGRQELRFMIDADMHRTEYVDVAEQHHLAWILGCICGVRPGSLGFTSKRPDNYMRWKHVKITRSEQIKFTVELEFEYLKGYNDDDGELHSGDLIMTVTPPENPDNIPLNPGYYMLLILLRRGFLKRYENFSQLLAGHDHHISIKEEALEQPIFLAAKEGGRGLNPGKAASAVSLSSYLRLRADEVGFTKDIGFYAWRRGTATNLSAVKSREVARTVLNHRPGSHVLEGSRYLDMFKKLDIGSIAYGEDVQAGEERMKERSHEVLYRAELQLTKAEQDKMVEAYVEKYIDRSSTDQKLQMRRLRREAKRELRSYASKIFQETFTMEQIKERQEQLSNRSKMADTLYKRARARLRSQRHDSIFVNEYDNEDEDFLEPDEEEADESYDAGEAARVDFAGEDTPAQGETEVAGEGAARLSNDAPSGSQTSQTPQTVTLNVQTDAAGDLEPVEEVSYELMVYEFFDFMLQKQLLSGEPRLCQACVADETMDQEAKTKLVESIPRILDGGVVCMPKQQSTRKADTYAKQPIALLFHRCLSAFSHNTSRKIWKAISPTTSRWHAGLACMYTSTSSLTPHIMKANSKCLETSKQEDGWLCVGIEAVPLKAERAADLPGQMTSIATVGPASDAQRKRAAGLGKLPGVLTGTQSQSSFAEMMEDWPVDTSEVFSFGSTTDSTAVVQSEQEPEEENGSAAQRLRAVMKRSGMDDGDEEASEILNHEGKEEEAPGEILSRKVLGPKSCS